MNPVDQSGLGKPTRYSGVFDPTLLFPIAREPLRAELGIARPVFFGADLWTAFELSWLTPRGKPQVALAHFIVPCETRNLIESKSFKLYLNSFGQTRFTDAAEVTARLKADLNEALWRGGPVQSSLGVQLIEPSQFDTQSVATFEGLSLDRLDLECTHYTPEPGLLRAAFDEQPVSEILTSDLLKSNCPVTGQPDWGSIQISYSGPQIEQGGLLQYIVSFREHNGFHEQCVERIFMDLWTQCKPAKLSVYARYTRRGGLDINPFRTSHPQRLPANVRLARQ